MANEQYQQLPSREAVTSFRVSGRTKFMLALLLFVLVASVFTALPLLPGVFVTDGSRLVAAFIELLVPQAFVSVAWLIGSLVMLCNWKKLPPDVKSDLIKYTLVATLWMGIEIIPILCNSPIAATVLTGLGFLLGLGYVIKFFSDIDKSKILDAPSPVEDAVLEANVASVPVPSAQRELLPSAMERKAEESEEDEQSNDLLDELNLVENKAGAAPTPEAASSAAEQKSAGLRLLGNNPNPTNASSSYSSLDMKSSLPSRDYSINQ